MCKRGKQNFKNYKLKVIVYNYDCWVNTTLGCVLLKFSLFV